MWVLLKMNLAEWKTNVLMGISSKICTYKIVNAKVRLEDQKLRVWKTFSHGKFIEVVI
jgi:hypothetical protein